MKYPLLTFFAATLSTIHLGIGVKRFTVVSRPRSIVQLYSEVCAAASSNCTEGIDIDGPSRERICRDISSSRYFSEHGQRPAGENSTCFSFCRPKVFTKEIEVPLPEMTVRENVFTCAARTSPLSRKEYYVSPEYNLDKSTVNPSFGRFVFHVEGSVFALYALAEEPAGIFFGLEYSIELIYLRRKEIYNVADRKRRDPLCKLEEKERARICSAVFIAAYFERKFKFTSITAGSLVRGSCESNWTSAVSFQTAEGEEKADGREHKEWMMTCEPATSKSFEYLLSQAYEPNQIFVYRRDKNTRNVFLEALGTCVRLDVLYPSREIQTRGYLKTIPESSASS